MFPARTQPGLTTDAAMLLDCNSKWTRLLVIFLRSSLRMYISDNTVMLSNRHDVWINDEIYWKL
jgi:hypothetical protein